MNKGRRDRSASDAPASTSHARTHARTHQSPGRGPFVTRSDRKGNKATVCSAGGSRSPSSPWGLATTYTQRLAFKILDSRQLYYLIDEKLMTWFAVKMELYYTLNYSYHKIYTTQMNRLQFPMMIIHQTFEHNYTSKNIKPQALREPARHKRHNNKL